MTADSSQTPSIAEQLSQLSPGKLPLDVFNQVARLSVTPVVELVPLYRGNNAGTQVFLLQRSADDALWAGMYHVPGSIVLSTDQPGSFAEALSRARSKLASYELSEPVFVEAQLCKVARGMEVALVYAVELKDAPSNSSALFSQQDLPDNLIEGQRQFIEAALSKL